MLLFSLLQLIYTLFTKVNLICTFVAEDTNAILSIDEIPKSILSLISSDVYDNHTDRSEFLNICRPEYANNSVVLSTIDKFELDHEPDQAIYWYTRDTFFYRMTNKILRSKNPQLINAPRPHIRDLHDQISRLHRNKYQHNIVEPSQTYYRGTFLSSKDIEKLLTHRFITFASFISTSSSRSAAFMFAKNALLEIEVNNKAGPYGIFCSVTDLSRFKDEEETVTSIGNIFQVEQVYWCEEKSLWEIKLTLLHHINHHPNFEIHSANNIKSKLIEYVHQRSMNLSTRIRKIFRSYIFMIKSFLKRTLQHIAPFREFFYNVLSILN